MIWPARSFYASAMLLAAFLPIVATRCERAPSVPAIVSNRMGLTLGQDDGGHVVVTSLRSGGGADRHGIRVGDRLTGVAGHPVATLTAARKLVHAPHGCTVPLTLNRHGISYRTIIWQCGRTSVG